MATREEMVKMINGELTPKYGRCRYGTYWIDKSAGVSYEYETDDTELHVGDLLDGEVTDIEKEYI